MSFSITHSKKIFSVISKRLMHQYRSDKWKQIIQDEIIEVVNERENQIIKPLRRNIEGLEWKLEKSESLLKKFDGSFGSRIKYLFTGKV